MCSKNDRKSIRLRGYDYSKPGRYFVTILTYARKPLFGSLDWPADLKDITEACWNEIPTHYPEVRLHEFVVMPDHLHGIIEIMPNEAHFKKEQPEIHEYQKIIPKSLGSIIRGFKLGVTKKVHEKYPDIKVWARNYHESIVRNDAMLYRIKNYIKKNPEEYLKSLMRNHQKVNSKGCKGSAS